MEFKQQERRRAARCKVNASPVTAAAAGKQTTKPSQANAARARSDIRAQAAADPGDATGMSNLCAVLVNREVAERLYQKRRRSRA